MLYFFRRGAEARACETRLNPTGPGFQLVVSENGDERIEEFSELEHLLSRKHRIVQEWRTAGWQESVDKISTPPGGWLGP